MKIPRIAKEHAFFIFFYGALFVSFLWPLLSFQKTFIFGDYWQQHYPWAHEYARRLLDGTLPYWVRGMACGFPLVAEGQIGAYYLPNLLFYRALPFFQAYNLSIIFHVFAGGLGFYAYLRQAGLSRAASAVGAGLFSFGSGYGGCFTNTAALRAMSWLPWCLWAIEALDARERKDAIGWASLLGLMLSQMWTAGASQAALYATGYLALYWLAVFRLRRAGIALGALAAALVLSAPQWFASYELLKVSVRAGESAAFALWGSVIPPALSSLAYPKWGEALGVSFYLGEAALVLCLAGLVSKKAGREKAHYGLAVFFMFLAIGKYDPAYRWAVEKLSITFFRNPSKFLFFAATSLSAAAAFGYDHLGRMAGDSRAAGKFRAALLGLSAVFLAGPAVAAGVFRAFSGRILSLAKSSASEAFSQKKDPLYSLAEYQGRAEAMYRKIAGMFGYADPWNLTAMAFFLLTAWIAARSARPKAPDFWRKAALPAVLFADLLVFGMFTGTGFVGNARTASDFSAPLVSQMRRLQVETGGSFVEWAKDPSKELFAPNANLHYELDSPSGYSPLLIREYYELFRDLGIADSSLGRAPFSEEVWRRETGLWRLAGTAQIVADEELDLPGLSLYSKIRQGVPSKKGLIRIEKFWYRVENPMPAIYAVSNWRVLPDKEARLAFLKSADFDAAMTAAVDETPEGFTPTPGAGAVSGEISEIGPLKASAELDPAEDALVVFRNVLYPGWKARVDGEERPIVAADHAFCGVFVKKGPHRVEFYYDNRRQVYAERAAVFGAFVLVYANFLLWKRRRAAATR